jgi:hypothetical protein
MKTAAEYGGGRYYEVNEFAEIPRLMREDLNVDEIKEVNYEPFTPQIKDKTSAVSGINQEDMPQLNGFYGTRVRSDDSVSVVLTGAYVPIYAQWKYGKGTVGSFMCDLNGTWSEEFLSSPTGQLFINNVISGLFPTTDISPSDIEVQMVEDNYTTTMSVYTTMELGDTLEVTITSPSTSGGQATVQTFTADSTNYSRISFVIKEAGLHEITLQKKSYDGTVVAEYTTYKTFSYSEEYDVFADSNAALELMVKLATEGKGATVTEGWEVFEDFVKSIHVTKDPRIPFIIIAIVLFLLDIAVRKFKFKWPHEIIRDQKAKKEKQQSEK